MLNQYSYFNCCFICAFTHHVHWSNYWCYDPLLRCEEEIRMSEILLSDSRPQAAEATSSSIGPVPRASFSDSSEHLFIGTDSSVRNGFDRTLTAEWSKQIAWKFWNVLYCRFTERLTSLSLPEAVKQRR